MAAPKKPTAPAKKAAPAPKKAAAPAKKPAPAPKKAAAPAPKKAPAAPAKKAAAPAKKPAPAATNEEESLLNTLLQASGAEAQGGDEDLADFQVRLATAISEMPDKTYAKLSEEAKAWFNAAVEAINDEKLDEIPGFESEEEAGDDAGEEAGDDAGEEEAGDDAGEEEAGEEEAPAPKKAPAKKAKDEKPAKKAKPAAEDAEPPRTSGSGVARIIICENPGISLADLKAELKKRGVKITDSQIHAVHNMTTRVLKVLKHLGKLK